MNGDFNYPKAYLIGVPRSGTTALARYLSEHPEIEFSNPKEPNFFADDFSGMRNCTTVADYRAAFSMKKGARLLMEGSVWYLYSQTAVQSIIQARPDAQFVILLRNPVTMLPSLHRKMYDTFDEDQADFRTAWDLSNSRAHQKAVPPMCRAAPILDYTSTAAYGAMISRLFDVVPPERCLIHFYEDFEADPGGVYRRTLGFLGLGNDGQTSFPRVNTTTRLRSRRIEFLVYRGAPLRRAISAPIKKLLGIESLGYARLAGLVKSYNRQPDRPTSLPDDLRDQIVTHYRPDMRHLGRLLKVDLSESYGWPS